MQSENSSTARTFGGMGLVGSTTGTLANSGGIGIAPRPTAELPRELDILSSRINGTDQLLGELVKQLSPVLMPDVPANAVNEKVDRDPVGTDVGRYVSDCSQRVAMINRTLQNILNRLAV